MADEVGLGKTIEAALVLCQLWAERRRRLLVLCPASLRKQWATELADKFNLPTRILDAKAWNTDKKSGIYNPFEQDTICIASINFAARAEKALSAVPWDIVVIDEAHKLRNAHRDSNVMGQALKRALAGCRKLLLTATPLQNSLLELYGLSTLIDEQLFGDRISFRSMFMGGEDDLPALRKRMQEFAKRTLRKDVLEYIQYTQRKPITIPFEPGETEQRLYDLVSGYLSREGSYGIPKQQRHLVGLILRKLLASSTAAVVATLEAIHTRLVLLRDKQTTDDDWLSRFIDSEDFGSDDTDESDDEQSESSDTDQARSIDPAQLNGEIAELEQYITLARTIKEDKKSIALVSALEIGFARMAETGAARKAVIFTESTRTQSYLARFLEAHGYAGRVATFSGRNPSDSTCGIYSRWLALHAGSDRVTGSPAIDKRTAIIDHFRTDAEILICTESGAEGINLQFCSLVINYDLPWNPQRVEQRIGRCHRYGQKHDVVVINFLNRLNAADQRVLELLSEKLRLFDGVFGSSDAILGRIESGVDFERRIAAIYDTCRTPEEIDSAFAALRAELEESIDKRMRETEAKLLENFDGQILDRLRVHRDQAVQQLDRISQLFWRLSRYLLQARANFYDRQLQFELLDSPCAGAAAGQYQLIRKGQPLSETAHTYRLTHPLGEYVLDAGRRLDAPMTELVFDLSSSAHKISVLEKLGSPRGWLELNLLELESFQLEEHLVFTAQVDDGTWLDSEACEQMMGLPAVLQPLSGETPAADFDANVRRQIEATLSRALEENNEYFQREREKLEAWAEDQIHSAEQALHDTKDRIKDAKRRARAAVSVDEQAVIQNELKGLERTQRTQRQQIFDVEDEIEAKRDELITALQRRLNQQSRSIPLFRIRWRLA